MVVLYMIILGTAAGFIATRLMGLELGVLPTVSIGVLGALIGGFILRFIVSMLGITASLVGAVFGAVLLTWAYKRFMDSRS